MRLRLPAPDRRLEAYESGRVVPVVPVTGPPPRSRVAYAAAHVVADPLAETAALALDWDATLAFRRHLWSLGLGVAEALDTAQRGMGLDWETTRALISRSVAAGREAGGAIVCGAGTDQLGPGRVKLADVTAAYEEQIGFVESVGGRVVLMASRALAVCAAGPDDYAQVYGKLLAQVREPVILHWLGEVFDPALSGYWGSSDLSAAADVVVSLCSEHADRVDGVKLSVLDRAFEVALRERLPHGVRLYTGDDFNYSALIEGGSDALLGVFDPIAPVAVAALRRLDEGDVSGYRQLLDPTVPLARHLFAQPTFHYKTGVVFLAWLAGHQDHFRMVGAMESARSVVHLARLYRLADGCGLLPDPERAAGRMRHVLALAGVEA